MLDPLLKISLTDAVDILFVSLLIWAIIAWMRHVRANLALLGLGIIGLFYLVALQLELQLTAWIFQSFFAILVVLLVVVFQDDLRRLFERIAVLGLRRRRPHTEVGGAAAIYRTLQQLAESHTGALLIIPGREPIERHLQGGVVLDANISEELLLSIFDPHSPGHDGAVLVQGDRLARFGVHLPLSEDNAQLGAGGTRHAAALGLAERCDALCVAVSEERGTISVAAQGKLTALASPSQLLKTLQDQLVPQGNHRTSGALRWRRARRGFLEGGTAVALALASWLALVPGSAVDQAKIEVQVTVENMPDGYDLRKVEPASVALTVSGPKRQLLVARTEDFQVVIDAQLVRLGRRTFDVREAVRHSTALQVRAVKPGKVRLSVSQAQGQSP